MSRRRNFADKQVKKDKKKKDAIPDLAAPSKTMAPPPSVYGGNSDVGSSRIAVKSAPGGDGAKEMMAPVKLPTEEVDPEFLNTPPPDNEQLPPELSALGDDLTAHIEAGGSPLDFPGYKAALQQAGEGDKQPDQTMQEGEGEKEEELVNENETDVKPEKDETGGDGGSDGGEDGGTDTGTDGGTDAGADGGTDGGTDGNTDPAGNPNGDAGNGAGNNNNGTGGPGGGAGAGAGGGASSAPQVTGGGGGNFGAGTEPQFSVVNEDALSLIGSPEVVQNVGGGDLLVLGAFDLGGEQEGGPLQMQTDPNKKKPKAKSVPADLTKEALDPEREKCNGIIEGFQSSATTEIGTLTDLKDGIGDNLSAYAERGKGFIDGYAMREEGLITAKYMLAQGQVMMESVTALTEAMTIKTEAESKVNSEAEKQIQAITSAADTQLAALDAAGPKIIADVAKAIADGKAGMEKAATDKGKAAEAKAEGLAKGYEAESVPDMSWGEKLRYGPGYEKRKRSARADAARQVGKGYAESFLKKAQEEAAAFAGAESEVANYVNETIGKAREAINARKTADIASINTAKQGALDAIKAAYDAKVQAGQAEVTRVNGELDRKMGEDIAEVQRIAAERQAAIDTQLGTATTTLQTSVQTSIDQFTEGANTAAQEAKNAPMPDAAVVQQAMDEALGKLKAGIGETKTKMDTGIAQAGAAIESMGTETESVLAGITTNAQTTADGLVGEAKAKFRQLLDELRDVDMVNATDPAITQMQGTATEAVTFINQTGTDTVTGLNTMVTNLQTKMTENAEGLATDFQSEIDTSLDAKVKEEAEKAADSVPSMWAVIVSWAVKILVAIAITAVCCALIASGAGLLTVILVGAVMGAVGGAATYMTDVGLGMQEFSGKGLAMAVGTGALSGAITGLGAGAGAAFTNAAFGAGAQLTAKQAVISYVGETVIGTTIDTIGAGVMNMVTTGQYTPAAFGQGMKDSFVTNLAGNAIGGLIGMKLAKMPRFQQMFTKLQDSAPIRGIMKAEEAVFGRPLNFDGPNGLGGGGRNTGPETSNTTAPETTTTNNTAPETSTTKPPETTTNNTTPETTTKPPETTTNNTTPETTTKPPETTTNNTTPETTTKPPETTTKPPETTTKPPETSTTKPPETTTKPPENSTTKPPETTTNNTTPENTNTTRTTSPENATPSRTLPQGSVRGTELAENLGYPKAPEGYHWANYDGKPVMRRNPGNAQSTDHPQLRYQPETRTFEVVGTDTAVHGDYVDQFLSTYRAPSGGGNNSGGLDADGFRVEASGVQAGTKSIDDVTIDADGIATVKQHLRQEGFTSGTKSGEWDHNEMMIQRLEKIARGELEPTLQDKNFYAHETGEASLMKQYMEEGMSFDDAYAKAHAIISKQYGVQGMSERNTFYTKDANEAFDQQIMRESGFGPSGGIPGGRTPRKVGNLQGGPLENASQVSGHFTLESGPPNGTLFRADNQGNITSYATYDENGMILKRVDVTGAAHRGVDTPHVIEYGRNSYTDKKTGELINRVQSPKTKNPPRPATEQEIP